MVEETVGYDEETVAFNAAVKFIKKSRRLFYKDISEKLGLTEQQGEQIRAGKRRASDIEIKTLIEHYPESAKFFSNKEYTIIEHNDKPSNQILNEPMGAHVFYGRTNEQPWKELAETQSKLIAKLEQELKRAE